MEAFRAGREVLAFQIRRRVQRETAVAAPAAAETAPFDPDRSEARPERLPDPAVTVHPPAATRAGRGRKSGVERLEQRRAALRPAARQVVADRRLDGVQIRNPAAPPSSAEANGRTPPRSTLNGPGVAACSSVKPCKNAANSGWRNSGSRIFSAMSPSSARRSRVSETARDRSMLNPSMLNPAAPIATLGRKTRATRPKARRCPFPQKTHMIGLWPPAPTMKRFPGRPCAPGGDFLRDHG